MLSGDLSHKHIGSLVVFRIVCYHVLGCLINLPAARRRRGLIHMSVTDLEITSPSWNKVQTLDAELKENHYAVINIIGDVEQQLDEE